ncbi:MAG: putative anti-sigma factor antagonist [Bacteroidetes bacterium]|jgi:anti-anti-sigma factor|nr:putative anti-sigma factor antagonist [Bacteroidota bacterium]
MTEFTIHKKDQHAEVSINVDKLDSSVSPLLKSELVILNSDGIKYILFDLKNARYCDSSGLSAILVGNRLCKNAGGKFVLCNLNDTVKKLISISQLDSIIHIANSIEEGLQKLS